MKNLLRCSLLQITRGYLKGLYLSSQTCRAFESLSSVSLRERKLHFSLQMMTAGNHECGNEVKSY